MVCNLNPLFHAHECKPAKYQVPPHTYWAREKIMQCCKKTHNIFTFHHRTPKIELETPTVVANNEFILNIWSYFPEKNGLFFYMEKLDFVNIWKFDIWDITQAHFLFLGISTAYPF